MTHTRLAGRIPIPIAVLGALALAACPPAGSEGSGRADATTSPAPCAKFGQTCEVSPGKLGTCVVRDGCTEPVAACFVCQSQH